MIQGPPTHRAVGRARACRRLLRRLTGEVNGRTHKLPAAPMATWPVQPTTPRARVGLAPPTFRRAPRLCSALPIQQHVVVVGRHRIPKLPVQPTTQPIRLARLARSPGSAMRSQSSKTSSAAAAAAVAPLCRESRACRACSPGSTSSCRCTSQSSTSRSPTRLPHAAEALPRVDGAAATRLRMYFS